MLSFIPLEKEKCLEVVTASAILELICKIVQHFQFLLKGLFSVFTKREHTTVFV